MIKVVGISQATNYTLVNLDLKAFPSFRVVMICLDLEVPPEICAIDDELKAIYHSKDSVCIFIFNSRVKRNEFLDKTMGMNKAERAQMYLKFLDEQNL